MILISFSNEIHPALPSSPPTNPCVLSLVTQYLMCQKSQPKKIKVKLVLAFNVAPLYNRLVLGCTQFSPRRTREGGTDVWLWNIDCVCDKSLVGPHFSLVISLQRCDISMMDPICDCDISLMIPQKEPCDIVTIWSKQYCLSNVKCLLIWQVRHTKDL